HDRSAAPGKRNVPTSELPSKLAVAHAFRVFGLPRSFTMCDERRALCRELLRCRVLARKSGDRNWGRMIPVMIELARHLLHHRPDDCHVEVGIIHRLVSSEIFVANVAAADG